MNRLDRYIIGKFLGTFFFILSILMSIAVVFDLAEKLEDFINFEAPVEAIIFDYYLNFIFFYANLFSSLIIFISVIFFTSKMARNNEIVAILSGGVSYNRMLRPFMLSAVFLALSSIFLNHFVLPRANKVRLDFEERYAHNPFSIQNVHMEVEPGTYIYYETFYKGELTKFWMEKWEEGTLKSTLYAYKAIGDSLSNNWQLRYCFVRHLRDGIDSVISKEEIDTTFSFSIKDMGQRNEFASSMTYPELSEYIRDQKNKGNANVIFYEIEMHQRTAYPMAAFILTMIAVAISGRKTRGGLGVHLAAGLLIAVLYIFSMRVTTVAATNAGLPPSIAVWIPNLLFTILTIPFYRFAQK